MARFTDGVDARRRGRQPEAERTVGLVRRFPASYEVHQYLGALAAAGGAHTRRSPCSMWRNVGARGPLVESMRRGRWPRRAVRPALDRVDKGLALEPETFYGDLTKGDVSRAAGERAAATEALRDALAVNPGLAVAEYELGRIAEARATGPARFSCITAHPPGCDEERRSAPR